MNDKTRMRAFDMCCWRVNEWAFFIFAHFLQKQQQKLSFFLFNDRIIKYISFVSFEFVEISTLNQRCHNVYYAYFSYHHFHPFWIMSRNFLLAMNILEMFILSTSVQNWSFGSNYFKHFPIIHETSTELELEVNPFYMS